MSKLARLMAVVFLIALNLALFRALPTGDDLGLLAVALAVSLALPPAVFSEGKPRRFARAFLVFAVAVGLIEFWAFRLRQDHGRLFLRVYEFYVEPVRTRLAPVLSLISLGRSGQAILRVALYEAIMGLPAVVVAALGGAITLAFHRPSAQPTDPSIH
ncbi:MAG: hypothetical protein U0835_15710 [Isosphaeraceae bacterium]